jgi:hypothetical protein
MKKNLIIFIGLIIGIFTSCNQKQETLTPEQAKQIAEEAYIYAFPMLDHYKMMFDLAKYPESGAYEGPFNTIINKSVLLGPEYTTIVRPNNDTFYTIIWFNLTGGPMVLKVPAIVDNRYYSFQIVDKYTHNIDYIGTRATGFDAGAYLFVGPNWKGEKPEGINRIIKSEGNYLVAVGRTQVFNPIDIDAAKAVQANYKVQTLNDFLGKETTSQVIAPAIPPYNPEKVTGVEFITYLNAIMADGKVHESERALFEKFAKIGIGPGKSFDVEAMDSSIVNAIKEGIVSAQAKIKAESSMLGEQRNGWQLISGAFGTREAMKGKYLTRAAAAYFGLWGNDLEEAFYPESSVDGMGDALDGSKHNYVLHFDKDEIPPVKAFWSLSMYKLPEQLFIENEIDRYVISSATEGLQYNNDGSLDVYIQKENPEKDKVSNWLPAHDGLFSLQARLYWPSPENLNPLYVMPVIKEVN